MVNKQTAFATFLLLVCLHGISQSGFQHVWSRVLNNQEVVGGTVSGYGITSDASGNTYIVGSFSNTADVDPGANKFNLFSAGSNDVYITKFSPTGTLLFAKSIGGSSADEGYDVAVDGSGNVYVTGSFSGTIGVDLPYGKTKLVSAGGMDVFMVKFDASGNFLMAFREGNNLGDDVGHGITVDSQGNILITGRSSSGAQSIFIAKYNASGEKSFFHKIGGPNGDYGKNIIADASGNIYVSGNFRSTSDFDPGAAIASQTALNGIDIFMAKYSISTSQATSFSTAGPGS